MAPAGRPRVRAQAGSMSRLVDVAQSQLTWARDADAAPVSDDQICGAGWYVAMITPVVVVTESTNRKVAGGTPSGNRRRPDPSTSGWSCSTYSSTRSRRISDRTSTPLPNTPKNSSGSARRPTCGGWHAPATCAPDTCAATSASQAFSPGTSRLPLLPGRRVHRGKPSPASGRPVGRSPGCPLPVRGKRGRFHHGRRSGHGQDPVSGVAAQATELSRRQPGPPRAEPLRS